MTAALKNAVEMLKELSAPLIPPKNYSKLYMEVFHNMGELPVRVPHVLRCTPLVHFHESTRRPSQCSARKIPHTFRTHTRHCSRLHAVALPPCLPHLSRMCGWHPSLRLSPCIIQ